jgi:hypothetical protein
LDRAQLDPRAFAEIERRERSWVIAAALARAAAWLFRLRRRMAASSNAPARRHVDPAIGRAEPLPSAAREG